MRGILLGILAGLGILFITNELVYAAHILEPLGTEIAATPPRGRMFGQMEYSYSKFDPEVGEEVTSHVLSLEFEVGVGERTQLNLEAEVLLEKSNGKTENGIEEMAFGLKHRLVDETDTLPDTAFLVEFAPAAGLKGNEAELKATILLTKNLTNRFLIHVETGYLLETEREVEVEGEVVDPGPPAEVEGEGKTVVENANIFVYNVAPAIRIIPDQLLFLVELNGESNFKNNVNEVTIAPEVILVTKNLALKAAVPFGLTDESPDVGFRVGLSKLF